MRSSIAPLQVDTSSSEQYVSFQTHITDDFGIAGCRRRRTTDVGDAELFNGGIAIWGSMDRISGTARDGIYEGQVRLPQGSVRLVACRFLRLGYSPLWRP